MILVVMGVCGSGKTTVGCQLAEKLNWSYADADEFHSEENRQKMSRGLPLTDEDRWPWLLSIHRYIVRLQEENQSGVVTCSALKKSYRNMLRFGVVDHDSSNMSLPGPENDQETAGNGQWASTGGKAKEIHKKELASQTSKTQPVKILKLKQNQGSFGDQILFVHLNGSEETIQNRMVTRQGHFMPVTLLQSQLQTLESLQDDEPGIEVDVGRKVDSIVNDVVDRLGLETRL